MFTYIHICIYVNMYMYTCNFCTYICIHVHVYAYMKICVQVCTLYKCRYLFTFIFMRTCIYVRRRRHLLFIGDDVGRAVRQIRRVREGKSEERRRNEGDQQGRSEWAERAQKGGGMAEPTSRKKEPWNSGVQL